MAARFRRQDFGGKILVHSGQTDLINEAIHDWMIYQKKVGNKRHQPQLK